MRDCKTRLRKAGFIVGEKSETTPTECLGFIGKTLDMRAGTISNSVGALVGAFRAWIQGGGQGETPHCCTTTAAGKALLARQTERGAGVISGGRLSLPAARSWALQPGGG